MDLQFHYYHLRLLATSEIADKHNGEANEAGNNLMSITPETAMLWLVGCQDCSDCKPSRAIRFNIFSEIH